MRIFVCEDSLDGILTGVYDGWDSRLGHDNVKLMTAPIENYELFADYAYVVVDKDKALKVSRTINTRLGYEAYSAIARSAQSNEPRKADWIYRVIVRGLSLRDGHKIMNDLSYEPVGGIFKLDRTVWHEAHSYMGFVRFRELKNGVLFSKIDPKHNVLNLIAPHFADRLPEENFMIYDERRHMAVVHQQRSQWFLMSQLEIDKDVISGISDEEEEFSRLWKCFVASVSIKERVNPRQQMTMMPLRYRDNIVEFSDQYNNQE